MYLTYWAEHLKNIDGTTFRYTREKNTMEFSSASDKDRIYFLTETNIEIPAPIQTDIRLEEPKEAVEHEVVSSSDDQRSAVDPVTGEIDWDCPCLKGATEPPCGEFFKAAFECFVKSTSEPKGEECMDKFVAMQQCFYEHPEVYRRALEDETDEEYINESDLAQTAQDNPLPEASPAIVPELEGSSTVLV